jgi:hypothetical protein
MPGGLCSFAILLFLYFSFFPACLAFCLFLLSSRQCSIQSNVRHAMTQVNLPPGLYFRIFVSVGYCVLFYLHGLMFALMYLCCVLIL